jgi:tetratricopeptide (TPR) repeat protein
MPVKIFFCYCHEDESLLNKLKAQLRPMQREGLIETWCDRDISAGMEWEVKIKEKLEAADIVLLLISPDFIDSDYCYSTEMQQALARHDCGDTKVIPIILRPVYWRGMLGKLQVLPKDALAVTDPDWHNLDRAFFNVAEGVRTVVNEINIQQYLVEVDDLYDKNKYHEAITLCEKIIGLETSCSDAYASKGASHWYLYQYEEALAAYNQAIFYSPREAGLYGWKAQIFSKLGRYEEALAFYSQAISLDDDYTSFVRYYDKGEMLQKLERYEEALTVYEYVIQLNNEDAYPYELKGDVLLRLARYEDALIAYNRATQFEPNDEELFIKKGEILQQLDREEEALLVYEKIIQLNSNSSIGYLNIGKILLSAKTPTTYETVLKALDAYEKAIEITPDSALAWQGKGIALLLLERYEEALTALTRAIELDPVNELVWHYKGMVYEQFARQSHKQAEKLGYHPEQNIGNILLTHEYCERCKKVQVIHVVFEKSESGNLRKKTTCPRCRTMTFASISNPL